VGVEGDVTEEGWVQGCLEPAGFDPGVPTVWLAVALVYYLPELGVDAMMRSVAGATAGGVPAAFLGTVMNQASGSRARGAAAAWLERATQCPQTNRA
jgi:O-methyltransferase involved in polyketide biosynthesis